MYAMGGWHKTYHHKKAPVSVIDVAVIGAKFCSTLNGYSAGVIRDFGVSADLPPISSSTQSL